MDKVSRTVRLDQADADRVSALKAEDESMNAAYVRVIHAGLESLEGDGRGAKDAGAGATAASSADDSAALVEELRARVEDLRTQVDVLTLQLDRKDEQIAARDAQVTAFTYTTQRALLASAETEERDEEAVEDVSQDDVVASSTTSTRPTFRERVAALFRHDR